MRCPACQRSFEAYPDEQQFEYCPYCGHCYEDEPEECEHRWRDYEKVGIVCRDCNKQAPPDIAAWIRSLA